MSVKLEFALLGNELIHISERMSKSTVYLCPLCTNEVLPRKGSIRKHHFYHRPGTNCSASEETILHFNAKHYLKHCINNRIDLDNVLFNIPAEMLDDSLKKIVSILGINHFPLSLKKIVDHYYLKNAAVEQKVNNFIVDVLIDCYENRIVFPNGKEYDEDYGYDVEKVNVGKFIFEVKVTHEIGEKKEEELLKTVIPFIEAIPEQTEKGFNFWVSSFSLKSLIQVINSELINLLSNHFEKELCEVGKKMYEEVKEVELGKRAIKKMISEVDKINFREHISKELFKKINTFKVQAYKSEVVNTTPLLSIKYKTSREGKNFISINDFLSWYGAENILFDLVKKLHSLEYNVNLLIGGYQDTRKDRVVGFEFQLPDKYLYGEQMKNIVRSGLQELLDKCDEEGI
ncbi:competence protein CoiA family protein [Paenibacillus naphthalenovorans]|uniref:Competence protein CoiA-like N-terminal domain-containing protein n=1 Tax=Paenibacillus naphthalenovorans TaxID=162209 RepID=A0A0U2W6P8_9BACL|nr:competence protein CoiA family protein [Paenibacillus naphthalenovorans]ALS23173.1 hypothetical protein IJ22_28000 [Paenibacillus naphthalenovorans]